MTTSSVKTVRFSQVVEKSGRPEPYTLWLDPKSDVGFQRALREHRVMSVHQENVGGKADYGEIGFTGTHGELLIFPKSLKTFAGKRVVGVKYDLLKRQPDAPQRSETPPARATAPTPRQPKSASAQRVAKPSAPR